MTSLASQPAIVYQSLLFIAVRKSLDFPLQLSSWFQKGSDEVQFYVTDVLNMSETIGPKMK